MKFNIDNPFFEFMTTLTHFVGLNLLFLITCLPVITIGPALAALYYVTIKESAAEGGYIIKGYLKAFRDNFKQGIAAMLIFLFSGAVFLFNLSFWFSFGTTLAQVLFMIILVVFVLFLISFIYTFPLMGRYKNTVKQTIKNSIFIGLQNLKQTLLLLLMFAAVGTITYFFWQAAIFMLLLGFAFFAYCASFILKNVFVQYDEI